MAEDPREPPEKWEEVGGEIENCWQHTETCKKLRGLVGISQKFVLFEHTVAYGEINIVPTYLHAYLHV